MRNAKSLLRKKNEWLSVINDYVIGTLQAFDDITADIPQQIAYKNSITRNNIYESSNPNYLMPPFSKYDILL